MADEAGTVGAVDRWAAEHARTMLTPAPSAGQPAAEPRQAMVASFSQAGGWDAGHEIRCVAWGSRPGGGSLLATGGGDGVVLIWDAANGRRVRALTGHAGAVLSAAWVPDGERALLATAGRDHSPNAQGEYRIWDTETGECLDRFPASNVGGIGAVPFPLAWGNDRDGRPLLLVSVPDAPLAIRDLTAGQSSPVEVASGQRASACAWARGTDGRPRLAYGHYSNEIFVMDPDAPRHQVAGTVYDPWAGRRGDFAAAMVQENLIVESMAYGLRADGELLLAVTDRNNAYVWTEADGTLSYQDLILGGSRSGPVRISWAPFADGRMLLAVSRGDVVRVWDGYTLDRIPQAELAGAGTEEQISAVAWAPTPDDRPLLAVASEGGRLRIWEAVLEPPVSPPAGRPGNTAARRPAQRQEAEGRLVLPPEEVTLGLPPTPATASSGIEWRGCVATTTLPDGTVLLAAADSQDVELRELATGRQVHTLTGHTATIQDLDWAQAPDGRLLLATAGTDGTARIWDADTGDCLHALPGQSRSVYAVTWVQATDGRLLLATANSDDTAQIWDPDSGSSIHTLGGHGGLVWCAAWGRAADGRPLLATGDNNGDLRIWNPDTGQNIRTIDTAGSVVWSVACTRAPDGRLLLATGGGDSLVKIWDADTGQDIRTMSGHNTSVHTVAWTSGPDGRLLLASADSRNGIRIWDPDSGAELASLPGSLSQMRKAVCWTRDQNGSVLLLAVNHEPGHGPVRAWRVATVPDAAPPDLPADPSAAQRTADAAGRLLRLGAGGLWPPLGLLTDLTDLTGPDAGPATSLHEARFAVLADEPGIIRLRGLAAGQPSWDPDARTAFAALLGASLDVPARYAAPDGAEPGQLRDALTRAAARPAGGDSSPPWRAPVAELRAAAAAIDDKTATLLAILGPQACAADPLLPLRLARHVPRLPVLSPRELRLLATASTRRPASGQAATGTLTYSPGTVGVARSGPLTRLLPTQLALPPDLRSSRLADNQLLYRQHRAPAPPAPDLVTIVLDTTPPTYGPAGTALRLAAHLITTTLWAHGLHPSLITLGHPGTPTTLRAPADLLAIWTPATLDPPGPLLPAARRTATTLGQPAVLLTHHDTARDTRYIPGSAHRLLTTHQPPEKPPAAPGSPWHAHISPNPSQAQLTTAIGQLLTPQHGNGR